MKNLWKKKKRNIDWFINNAHREGGNGFDRNESELTTRSRMRKQTMRNATGRTTRWWRKNGSWFSFRSWLYRFFCITHSSISSFSSLSLSLSRYSSFRGKRRQEKEKNKKIKIHEQLIVYEKISFAGKGIVSFPSEREDEKIIQAEKEELKYYEGHGKPWRMDFLFPARLIEGFDRIKERKKGRRASDDERNDKKGPVCSRLLKILFSRPLPSSCATWSNFNARNE
mgnify:CR=1 FL=1